jgi:hypothetical protein
MRPQVLRLSPHLLQLGLSEDEIKQSYMEFIPPKVVSENTFEEAKLEFIRLDKKYRSNKELPRQDLERNKQNTIETIADFEKSAQDKNNTSLQRKIAEKWRTSMLEDVQIISEAQGKFPDDPYQAFMEANKNLRRRPRLETSESFANEVDKLFGDIEKKR